MDPSDPDPDRETQAPRASDAFGDGPLLGYLALLAALLLMSLA